MSRLKDKNRSLCLGVLIGMVALSGLTGCGEGMPDPAAETEEAAQALLAASDTTPPTTKVTAPLLLATVKGTVTVSATASDNDNVGVTSVEFYAGTTRIGSTTASPYSLSWDTTTIANNLYFFTSKAYDAAGNVGTSPNVLIRVKN